MQKLSFKNRLIFRIPLGIISLVVAVIICICVIHGVSLSNSKNQSVGKEINYLAENNAYLVSSYLNNMQSSSKSLAAEVYRYKNSDSRVTDKLIRATLGASIDDARIYATFVAFEPNAFMPNTPKGLSYYSYKSDGEKKLEVMNDYDAYNPVEYYAVTKKTLKPHITEPYSFKLATGETVWLITVCNPILDESGKFLGVTNTDILTSTINNLSYNTGGYQTSSNYILTDASVYVSNTADKKKAGTKYTNQNNKDVFEVTRPLQIEGVDSHWSSTFIVQKSEALKEVSSILWLIIIIGLIGIVIITVVVFLLLKKALSPIDSIVAISTNMGNGKLSSDITVHTKDELGQLANLSIETSKQLSEYVYEISAVLGKLSNGNFDVRVSRDFIGDFEPIKNALLTIIDSLNRTFHEIVIASNQVSTGANEIADGSQVLAQGATEQANSLQEISTSINIMANQVKQNANNANNASALAKDSERELDAGKQVVAQMLNAMDEIKTSSTEIARVIKTIDDIASQTNILALNASVEAARAGVVGKGFAVVADEVRNLASKSSEAAKRTGNLIQGCASAVDNGARIAEKTAALINLIVEKSAGVNDFVAQITVASNEQANAIEQIKIGVTQISSVVQTNSATAEESSAAAEELSAQANILREKMARYELKEQNN